MATLFKIPSNPTPNFFATKTFDRCLGEGSFGIVLRAINNKSKKATAVKFIFPTEVDTQEQEQIRRECKITRELEQHENVVKVLDIKVKKFTASELQKVLSDTILNTERQHSLKDSLIGKAKRLKTIESICIEMELCGETLKQWINQQQNNSKVKIQQVTIVRNVISGLKHLHDQKIIHRDLKPDNVMFSKSGYQCPVKIGDFGLCRRVNSEATRLTSRLGTQDYMAPESYGNQYSLQADLFSLGLVIWEVAQLIQPSERRNLLNELVNNEDVSFVKEHPLMSGLRDLVIRLTKRRVKDRIQSIDHVMKIAKSWGHFDPTETLAAIDVNELKFAFENVASGGTIKLIKGEYVGSFILKKDNIKICGVEGTVLKWMGGDAACLEVIGNGCTISSVQVATDGNIGIKVTGFKNEIIKSKFTGGYPIDVTGDQNNLQDLHISNAVNGIVIGGCRNIVDGVEMQNVANDGIFLAQGSDKNSLSNITGRNVQNGIRVEGSDNDISKVSFIKNSEDCGCIGVWLYSGVYNSINNLTCSGYKRNEGDWGLEINSTNSIVKDSQCGPTWVIGSAELTNVDCGLEVIRVESQHVELVGCIGKIIDVSEKVTLSNEILTVCNPELPVEEDLNSTAPTHKSKRK